MNLVDLKEAIRNREWNAYRKRRAARLKRSGFSIICTNCIGGVMYHDLGLEFLTPTVNLTISLPDLVKMAGDLKWYMEQPLAELDRGSPFPTARLGAGDRAVQINFLHYDTFQAAKESWEERKRKINYSCIVLMGTDQDGCDYESLRRFDQLPYPNKLLFTHIPHPELSSACYIPGFEDRPEIGTLTNLKPQFFKRRYLDDFDYVDFLNRII